jgi:hypothetical protein
MIGSIGDSFGDPAERGPAASQRHRPAAQHYLGYPAVKMMILCILAQSLDFWGCDFEVRGQTGDVDEGRTLSSGPDAYLDEMPLHGRVTRLRDPGTQYRGRTRRYG